MEPQLVYHSNQVWPWLDNLTLSSTQAHFMPRLETLYTRSNFKQNWDKTYALRNHVYFNTVDKYKIDDFLWTFATVIKVKLVAQAPSQGQQAADVADSSLTAACVACLPFAHAARGALAAAGWAAWAAACNDKVTTAVN